MRIVLLFLLLTTLAGQGAYLGDISTTHSVTNLTALEALVVPDKTPVLLKGYYVEGDAPAVTYVFAAGDTSTVDNGSVITNAAGRFKLQPQGGRVDIRTFGAIGDWLEIGAVWTNTAGVTNITLASAPSTNYVGKKIALRRGNTSVGAEVTLLATDLSGTVISSFTVVSNGQGYINTPTNVLVSGPGSGATTTCVLTNGRLSSITVTGGGTGYTTNSVFKIRSTDCGTTNAPYYTELFSVSNQVGTTIGLSSTPTFSEPLNPYDEVGAVALYTDNQVALQAAVDYAAAHGLEVYIPQGDFGTGPVYLNAGQKIVGGGREIARLHSAAKIGFTTFRKSIFAPKNVNTGSGRQISDTRFGPAEISGFTIDGSAPYQSPLGTDLNNGNFAVFGINCAAVEYWSIHDMIITNCQGGAIYYGSWTPTAGLAGNWADCQSQNLSIRNCFMTGNWRQAHQVGNASRIVEDSCQIIDSSYGYYASQYARNLIQGSSIGQNGTYSPEQIDFEANSGATGGHNKFINCWFQNKYGKAADLYFDQEYTDFVDCTFKDCYSGAVTSSPASGAAAQNGQDAIAEWTTFQNCRFLCTSTNFGAHLIIKARGVKVTGCYFEGKTANTVQGNGDVVLDGAGLSGVPGYILDGNLFRDNTFNLRATDGTQIDGLIQIVGTTQLNIKNLKFDNTILRGSVDMRAGTDQGTVALSREAGLFPSEGYSYQSAGGGNPNYLTESATAGLGSQDWAVLLRYATSATTTKNGELFRWTANGQPEIQILDKIALATNFVEVWINPNNTGFYPIYVPISAVRSGFSSVLQYQRPINLGVVKTHGSVYKVTVLTGGTGYTSVPAVSFGGGAAAATAQIDLAAGTVTNIYVTAIGSGYTTNPIVTLTGGTVGTLATAVASAAKIDVLIDDTIIWTDYGQSIITNNSTSAGSIRIASSAGTQGRNWYAYGVWNKPLNEDQFRQVLTFGGPLLADQWGIPGSTLGCVTYVKFNSGLGYFFEDLSSQHMDLWCGQAVTHGLSKRTGQLIKHLAVTGATGGTNSLNKAVAASAVVPANARITSAYVVPQAGAAPTIRLGFDSAITDQLVAPVTLTANTTNYLNLVPSMVYGTTNRPVYIGQTGAATNDIVINYSLDQGGLDGSAIQSGIVTAPGGLGSTSAIAATAIDATGWTNTFGVNAMVYAEGTGLQYTVYNAGGTAVYTNAATVGSASIALQKDGKVIVIAGTGVSGRAVPW